MKVGDVEVICIRNINPTSIAVIRLIAVTTEATVYIKSLVEQVITIIAGQRY